MKTRKMNWHALTNQQNPGLAQPVDFEIVSDDEDIFHGQRSDALISSPKVPREVCICWQAAPAH